MVVDYISISISLIVIFGFVLLPRRPATLLLFFIFIYILICFWHIYDFPIKDLYLTSVPAQIANRNDLNNKFITDFDLFFNVGLFSLVIILSRF